MTATAFTERRELAHRTSDGIEVTLFWTKPSDRVTIAVLDTRSGEALEFDVDGRVALDAFNHPYAYAARPTSYLEPTDMTTPIVTETRRNGNQVGRPASGGTPAPGASTNSSW